MDEKEQQAYIQTMKESLALIESVGEAEFSSLISPKRNELETLLRSLSPFNEENAIKIIVDYAMILDAYHSQETKDNTKRREHYEHLLVSCFNVGFALGVGKDCTSALPVLALSGAHLELGKKLLLYHKRKSTDLNSES